jgi:hypothetical protein
VELAVVVELVEEVVVMLVQYLAQTSNIVVLAVVVETIMILALMVLVEVDATVQGKQEHYAQTQQEMVVTGEIVEVVLPVAVVVAVKEFVEKVVSIMWY